MGRKHPGGAYRSESDPAAGLDLEGVPISPRQIFREMVVSEIQDRPLSWRRRRALLRFGERTGIDPFEARLIVRGVEYECGHAEPAAMADHEPSVNTGYLMPFGPTAGILRLALLVLIGILLGLAMLEAQ